MKRIVIFIFLLICRFYTYAYDVKYWIDKDINNVQIISNLSSIKDLSLSLPDINEGFHLLTFQLSEDEIVWSAPYSFYFTKYNKEATDFAYIFDNNEYSSKLDLTDNAIDVSSLNAGMHTLTVYSTDAMLSHRSAVFYKSPSMERINLMLFDATQNLISSTTVNARSETLTMNVSNLKSGYHPISLVCLNHQNELIHTSQSLINKIPNGGNGIMRLDYVVDSDTENQKHILFDDSNQDFSYESLIDISDFNYTPHNTHFFISEIPYIAPKTNLHLFALDSRGFVLDSIVPFIDRYRKEQLDAPMLTHNKQHNFADEFTQPAWLSFDADSCDVVNFRVRRGCDVSLFSPEANPLYSNSLSNTKDNTDYTLTQKGIYYLKLSNITPSKQTFSVKLKYLNKTHSDDNDSIGSSFPKFDGILICWKDNDEWTESDNLLGFSSGEINISSHKSNIIGPRLSSQSDFVIPLEHSFCVNSKKFVTKIVFVPSSPYLINNTSLLPSNGNVELDSISNVVIWTGFNDNINFTVIDNSNSNSDFSKFYFRKMYVTFSNVDSDSRIPITYPFDSFDGTSYTHLYVWYDNISKDCYEINKIKKIGFNDEALVIIREPEEILYPKGKNYIITFENKDSSVDIVNDDLRDEPLIYINNGIIFFNNLPNFVSIYDIKGVEYFSSYISDSQYKIPIDKLGKGIYIIRVGNHAVKIIL